MIFANPDTGSSNTTNWKAVIPFYVYAAIAFLAATILLFFSSADFTQHYFHPHILAITHIMALGWGTMIILGASHQLVPVLIESKLYSTKLAYASFIITAAGIPLLAHGFYFFNLGVHTLCGGILIVTGIFVYIVNLAVSMIKSKQESVHAVFVFTAALWLLATTVVGLLLLINFSYPLLPQDSLKYLPVHAHTGIAGWFLLLVIGVGSRLIPMFLISKFTNTKRLWLIYGLINAGLLLFIFAYLYTDSKLLITVSFCSLLAAIVLFGSFCSDSYHQRIRKTVDAQMKLSLLSVAMMLFPFIVLAVVIGVLLLHSNHGFQLITVYGFAIFFGWLTAIIMGMTFKTLPFIVWNKTYHKLAGIGKTPNPKDLFNSTVFKWMSVCYLPGFILFVTGILLQLVVMLKIAAVLLVFTSLLFNWNVIKLVFHKPFSV